MNFGFLAFPGLEELDLVGPWEMISVWSRFLGGPEPCLLVAETKDPVVCAKGMSLNPHASFDECPRLDHLLVPGGQGTRQQVDNAPSPSRSDMNVTSSLASSTKRHRPKTS